MKRPEIVSCPGCPEQTPVQIGRPGHEPDCDACPMHCRCNLTMEDIW